MLVPCDLGKGCISIWQAAFPKLLALHTELLAISLRVV